MRTQPNQRDLLVLRMCLGAHGPRAIGTDAVSSDTLFSRVPLGTQHIHLKESFRRRSGDDGKLGCGQALRRLGLSFEGTAQRGIDDARNIARLLPYGLDRKPIPAANKLPHSG